MVRSKDRCQWFGALRGCSRLVVYRGVNGKEYKEEFIDRFICFGFYAVSAIKPKTINLTIKIEIRSWL